MKKKLFLFIKISLVLFVLESRVFAINGGAYNSSPGKRMDISSANNWLTYDFPVTTDPEIGSTITNIYYQYAISKSKLTDGSLVVNLCSKKTFKCVNISDSSSGMVSDFHGDDASSVFFMKYKIINHGGNIFIAGDGVTQITVNWSVN